MAALVGNETEPGIEERSGIRWTLAPLLIFPLGVAVVAFGTVVLIIFGTAFVAAAAALWCKKEA